MSAWLQRLARGRARGLIRRIGLTARTCREARRVSGLLLLEGLQLFNTITRRYKEREWYRGSDYSQQLGTNYNLGEKSEQNDKRLHIHPARIPTDQSAKNTYIRSTTEDYSVHLSNPRSETGRLGTGHQITPNPPPRYPRPCGPLWGCWGLGWGYQSWRPQHHNLCRCRAATARR